jgi:hypothetical protein
MPYAKPGDFSCTECYMPNLKIMGTVTVTGKSISGKLSLAKHENPNTGKRCPGTDSMTLLKHIVGRAR